MVGQKKWRIDIKWIVILAIVAFLLIFEVFPLFYLLIKSLFSLKKLFFYDISSYRLNKIFISTTIKLKNISCKGEILWKLYF
mgnify:CR=1 FL=1